MKKNRFKYQAISFVILWFVAQPCFLAAQTVKERFDKLIISENFDSISTYWTTLANADNLFIVQDGEYILQRRATNAPYAVIANFTDEFSNFRVVTSMKIDKSMGVEASIGLLFMMQKDGQGGFLFEINKNKEYRLRQIVGGSYRYLTGSSKDGGWIKSNAINEPNFSNMIEVKSFNKSFDLLINSVFLKSFNEPAYSSGKMGIIIGPDSRGKVDFMYVFTKSTASETANANSKNSSGENSSSAGPDIIELAESIIKLKTQINTLQEENSDLNKIISAMKSGEQDKDVIVRNFEKQAKQLQDQVKSKEVAIDSLKKVNSGLLKYKEIVGENENGDIIINLSKALKAEKEKNQKIEAELKELREGSGKSTPPKSNTKTEKPPIVGDEEKKSTTEQEPKGGTSQDSNNYLLPKNP